MTYSLIIDNEIPLHVMYMYFNDLDAILGSQPATPLPGVIESATKSTNSTNSPDVSTCSDSDHSDDESFCGDAEQQLEWTENVETAQAGNEGKGESEANSGQGEVESGQQDDSRMDKPPPAKKQKTKGKK